MVCGICTFSVFHGSDVFVARQRVQLFHVQCFGIVDLLGSGQGQIDCPTSHSWFFDGVCIHHDGVGTCVMHYYFDVVSNVATFFVFDHVTTFQITRKCLILLNHIKRILLFIYLRGHSITGVNSGPFSVVTILIILSDTMHKRSSEAFPNI